MKGNRFVWVRANSLQQFCLRVGRANGVVHSDNRCGARPAVDQPHLAENLAWTQAFVLSFGKPRFDGSDNNQERAVALISGLEDRFPCVERSPTHLVTSKTDDTGPDC